MDWLSFYCASFFLHFVSFIDTHTLDPGGANNGLFFSHSRYNLTSRRILNAANTQTEIGKNNAFTSANNHLSFIAIVPIVAKTMHFFRFVPLHFGIDGDDSVGCSFCSAMANARVVLACNAQICVRVIMLYVYVIR